MGTLLVTWDKVSARGGAVVATESEYSVEVEDRVATQGFV